MIKRCLLFVFFIFCAFFLNVSDTYAIREEYDYLYEITSLSTYSEDGEKKATVTGWAILNAGMESDSSKHYKTPAFNKNLASGSGDSSNIKIDTNGKIIKGQCGNDGTYDYSLQVIGYDSNNRRITTLNATYKNPLVQTDLTYSQCFKKSADWKSCSSNYVGACYRDVGFQFTFSLDELISSGAKYFTMKLTIISNAKSMTIDITIHEDKIKENTTELEFDVLNPITEIKLTTSKGYAWLESKYESEKVGVVSSELNYQYKICEVKYDSTNQISWYKIAVQEGSFRIGTDWISDGLIPASDCSGDKYWVPSAWTAPVQGSIMIEFSEPEEFNFCDPTQNTVQDTEEKTINACSGTVNFSGEQELTGCSVDIYDYYTLTCKENNFVANLSVNNIEGNSFNINNGGAFTALVNMKTKLECTYNFDKEKFLEDYDKVTRIINSTADNRVKAEYINKREKLNLILKRYYNLTNNQEEWDSGYDFASIGAKLEVDGKSHYLIQNGEIKHTPVADNYCFVSESTDIEIIETSGNLKKYHINSNVSCGEIYEKELIPKKACLSMETGEVVNCNDSGNQINGGNNIFVDMDKTNGEIKIIIEKAGFNENWNIYLQNCYYNSLNNGYDVKFRQIDLTDPFLINYDKTRGIGKNYSNSTYNFVNIIKSDIWSQNFMYQYSMSKENVKNIREDTAEEGVNSYLGRDCYFNNSSKYICSFTRNSSNNSDELFHKVTITD